MERAPARCSVCPEESVLARADGSQYISFGNEIRQGVARLTAHFQVTSCQVDTIIRCVEYFHPSAMHAIIVLKVVLIIHQDFVDDDFTARIRCGARTERTDHSRCEGYSGYVFVHN